MNAPGQRSGTPKVMGILMIIFASLGLLFGLIGLAGNTASTAGLKDVPVFKTWSTISMILSVVGLGISALHLFAGVRAVGYKANAPKLSVAYAALSIVTTLLNLILIFAWVKPAISKIGGVEAQAFGSLVGGMTLIFSIIALIWPTLVLILMTRPGSKAACTN